jgi:hypothetical protein
MQLSFNKSTDIVLTCKLRCPIGTGNIRFGNIPSPGNYYFQLLENKSVIATDKRRIEK